MREAKEPRIIEMIIIPQTPNSTKAAGKGVYEFFTSPNVKLSHPERVCELLVVIYCSLVICQPRERSG